MWLIFQDDFLDFPDIYCKKKQTETDEPHTPKPLLKQYKV